MAQNGNTLITDTSPVEKPEASSILKEALAAVEARRPHYGPPTKNFERIAAIWQPWLDSKPAGYRIQPVDVAWLNIGIKLARLLEDTSHHDSIVDIAGYADCMGEVKK